MATRGRPRKPGKRRNNRPVPSPVFDRGTERAQAMRAFYGTDCSDALGRAYRAGLLGDGDEAKALLDTGRAIARAYWQHYATGTYRCALAEPNAGTVTHIDTERARRRETWLNHCLREVGLANRRVFDQLVIDIHPDSGPEWLERLIEAKRGKFNDQPRDRLRLEIAVDALARIAC